MYGRGYLGSFNREGFQIIREGTLNIGGWGLLQEAPVLVDGDVNL